MSRRRLLLIGLPLAIVVAVVATLVVRRPQLVGQGPGATPAPTLAAATPVASPTAPPPRPRVGYTPVPENTISPIVIARSPARGEELRPDGSIELVFDRPMDQAAVAGALAITPAVKGSFAWPDARTVRFTPEGPLPRASVFDLVLGQGAKGQDGAILNGAYQFRFQTTGFLEVAQVIPAPGTPDAQVGSAVTVIFNRPVVPLVTSLNDANLPQPLRIEPPVSGKGRWLNTSIYVFTPDEPLAAGTTYTGRIDGALQDIAGNPLQGEYTWQWSVAAPQVLNVTPPADATLVPVDGPLQVQFNQPLAPQTGAPAISLSGDGGTVAGDVGIYGDILVFTPTQRLAFDTRYTATVGAGVGGAGGGASLGQPFAWSFTTVPLPQIVGTRPADGDGAAPPYTDFSIIFNTNIDPATVMPQIKMTPPISPTQVYTYFSDYDHTFHLGFGALPSTQYEVEIGPGIADPYGNTIGQGLTVRFTTDRLPPSVQLLSPDYVGTYSANEPARVVLSSVNTPSAQLDLYRAQPGDLIGYRDWRSNLPPASDRLRSWSPQLDAPLNETVNTRIDLREDGGPLEPGVYLLVVTGPSEQWNRYQLMVVSPLNITLKKGPDQALAWVTKLGDGSPAAGVPLDFFDDSGNKIGSAITDGSGVARLSFAATVPGGVLAYTNCSGGQPCANFTAASSGWANGISPYEYGIQQSYDTNTLRAFVYTDRPIYRPGQQVDFKGIVRAEDDVRYSPAPVGNANVMITAPDGTQVYQQSLQLSQIGTFDDKLLLGAGAALGQYSIVVEANAESFNFSFQVAAYRPPEFEVGVKLPGAETVRGTAINAEVDVSYFFGGPVANVPVQWSVLAQSERFAPIKGGGYTWSDSDDPWICFDCWWMPQVPPTPILSGSGTTDSQGRLQIPLPAQLTDSAGQPISNTVRLIIEATASGRDNQVIAGREQILVHSGDLYLGLRSRDYLGIAGQEQQIDLLAADPAGKRLAGRSVAMTVERFEWKNTFVADASGGGSWQSTEQRTVVAQQTLTTNDLGEATLRFTPDTGGSYRVRASATDSGGREVRSSRFLWVSGSSYIPWRRDNSAQLTLISDRTSYKPGETAAILIPSPFQGPTWALITVERGGILRHEVLQLQSNSTVYQLPITAEHAPNIFVSVALTTGPDGPGQPADYRLGYLPLLVAPEPQSLSITLTPDTASALPGSAVTYQVDVRDSSGAGVAADLSLDLVDKAVLSLQPRPENAIRDGFYGERGLGVLTASGLTISANRLLAQLEKQLKDLRRDREQAANSGADQFADGAAPQATTAPAAAPAPAQAQAGGRAAQESAPQAPPGVALRSEFADTAFWQPSFSTDGSGKGSVQISLPDNLTTWVLRGVGLTGDTRVGEGTVEVVATRPLLIRPVTPRFLVVGDTVELAANVSNNTDGALTAEVALAASGISLTTAQTVTLSVPPQGEAQATWSASVGDAPQADMIFSAVAGDLSDAAKPRLGTGPEGSLPIYRYSVPESVGTGGQLTAAGSRTEVIALPPSLDDSRGEVTLRLDPSLAAGVRDGLRYLEHYEYECTEQTVSRFLPNVLTYRALKDLGIANQELEARLPDLVKEGVDKLALRQNSDGGWGWWQTDESNPHISAYVVLGLLRAQEAGFALNGDMLSRGVAYLQSQVKTVEVNTTTDEANLQAFLLYILGESGQGGQNNGALQELLRLREKLGVYGKSFLGMALSRNNAGDPGIKTLLADLNTSAILSATGAHWEEESRDWWSMNTDTRTTAITLGALVRLDPKNQLTPNVVRWLMVARQNGIWETTQESAWAIMALTDWMRLTGELKGEYDYAAWLNEAERTSGRITPDKVGEPIVQQIAIADLLKDAGNRLTVGRGEGPGVLYYTAHLRAYLPVPEVKALDRGVIVRRRYTLASCSDGPECPEVREVKVGDVVRVELTLTAPNDLYYLRVEDPLPAGAEAVDKDLATTSMLAQGPVLRQQFEDVQPVPFEGVAPSRGPSSVVRGPFWWWQWYSRSELRDEKVVLFADYLAKGSYEYSYTMRATSPGQFNVIPTTASEFYFPEVYGRGDGGVLTIRR